MNIAWADVIRKRLHRVDGDDLCTEVHLVVIGENDTQNTGKDAPYCYYRPTGGGDDEAVIYLPAPYVVTRAIAGGLDAVYQAQRVFNVDKELDVFQTPAQVNSGDAGTYTSSNTDVTLASDLKNRLQDENDASYVSNNNTTGFSSITYSNTDAGEDIVGFKIRYYTDAETGSAAIGLGPVKLTIVWNNLITSANLNTRLGVRASTANVFEAGNEYELEATDQLWRDVFVIFPPHALMRTDLNSEDTELVATLSCYVDDVGGLTGAFNPTQFYPLKIDATKCNAIADSYLTVPSGKPMSVTVEGFEEVTPPDNTVTLTGYPGGDITLEIKRIIYDSLNDQTTFELDSLADKTRKIIAAKDRQQKELIKKNQTFLRRA